MALAAHGAIDDYMNTRGASGTFLLNPEYVKARLDELGTDTIPEYSFTDSVINSLPTSVQYMIIPSDPDQLTERAKHICQTLTSIVENMPKHMKTVANELHIGLGPDSSIHRTTIVEHVVISQFKQTIDAFLAEVADEEDAWPVVESLDVYNTAVSNIKRGAAQSDRDCARLTVLS